MAWLRTPDSAFDQVQSWPAPAHWLHPLGSDGPRMAVVDEGPRDAAVTALCLHGNPAWGYLYRHMLPVFTAAGLRVVAPDMIGFGRSDKPASEAWHTFDAHRRSLLAVVEQLDLKNILLVCQDWGGIFGLTLPMALPERFTRLLVMNTTLATGELSDGFKAWRSYSNSQPDLPVGKLLKRGRREMSDAEAAGYDAPYPDASFKAALRAFPDLVPDGDHAPGAATSREAQGFWQSQWSGESYMAVGMQDPVLGPPVMARLRQQIRGCPAPLEVAEAGHFVQEWGGPIATSALQHFGLTPR